MKKAYCLEIENLNCANCASKIEERLKREANVSELELNFMLKILKFKIDTEMTNTQVIQYMESIADNIEKGVKFKNKDDVIKNASQSFEFKIENLDCGNCASKIETRLKKEANIQDVKLNFMLKKLNLKMNTEMNAYEVAEYIRVIADDIEQGVNFIVDYSEDTSVDSRENTSKKKGFDKEIAMMCASGILLLAGILMDFNILIFISYILVGYDIILKAVNNCMKGRLLDENFLMTIATVAAFAIGEYPEAVAVMFFYKIGEYMQACAVDYSTREIEKAMDIRPEFARIIEGTSEKIVEPKVVRRGQIIQVKPGEKVPLDGEIIKGSGTLDTSMLTGESLFSQVDVGETVLSGSINKDGIIDIRVTEEFKDSTVSKILDLIKNASGKKSKSENFITKFARWYTPIIVVGAILTAIIPSIITGNPREWIYNSIVFLVISCPCALVVSVPLGFFAGIGAASRAQILVKGSNYLEELNNIDAIVLDKTGTITKGRFGVTHIIPSKVTKEEVLEMAAIAESGSNHPIAKSVVEAYKGDLSDVNFKTYKEISGAGVLAEVDGNIILAGNDKLMKQFSIAFIPATEVGSYIYIAKNNEYLGCIIVADEVKEDSKEAIALLKKQGIKKVVMLTGDKKQIAESIGTKVGVDEIKSELLPGDKVKEVEKLLEEYHVAFVGDGINDAPVLARANIGIAMGGVGSDAAIEASDVVLMTDKLTSISDVLKIAKRTRNIVTQNIVFALGIKLIVLTLGALGIANMWLAIFADVGVSIIAVINSIRVLGKDVTHMFKMLSSK